MWKSGRLLININNGTTVMELVLVRWYEIFDIYLSSDQNCTVTIRNAWRLYVSLYDQFSSENIRVKFTKEVRRSFAIHLTHFTSPTSIILIVHRFEYASEWIISFDIYSSENNLHKISVNSTFRSR